MIATATEYLSQWIENATQNPPSLTAVSCQRSTASWPNIGRGIASYGSSDRGGKLVRDQDGVPNGISFEWVRIRFSDRFTTLPSQVHQLFDVTKADWQNITFTIEPDSDAVRIDVVLKSWGDTTWSATTRLFDGGSEQLIFSIPGAGAAAPRAVLLTAFGPFGGNP